MAHHCRRSFAPADHCSQFSTRRHFMQSGGVPPDVLADLGLQRRHERMPYGDLLRSLPEEAAVQLEFWRSAPGEACVCW